MAAAMFMSTNSLPVAFIQSILVSGAKLNWGSHDNVDAMLGRALTYLIFYTVLSMIVSSKSAQRDRGLNITLPEAPVELRRPIIPGKRG